MGAGYLGGGAGSTVLGELGIWMGAGPFLVLLRAGGEVLCFWWGLGPLDLVELVAGAVLVLEGAGYLDEEGLAYLFFGGQGSLFSCPGLGAWGGLFGPS